MFWKDLKLSIDTDKLVRQFGTEFLVNDKINITDSRITNVGSGFLIVAKELDWQTNIVSDYIGCNIATVRIFITNPFSFFPMHRDCKGGKTSLREWAINIPLMNCDNGYNQWFSDDENYFGNEIYSESGNAIIPEDQTKIYNISDRQILNCPKLIRTDIHHNVDNTDNKNFRVILSYRSDDNISWNDIVSRVA